MKRFLLPTVASVLIVASLLAFYQLTLALARRDYVGAILLLFVGLALVRHGSDAARWSSLREK